MESQMTKAGALWLLKQEWGIQNLPSEADRERFAKALMICVNPKGQLNPEERAWAAGLAAAVGTPEQVVTKLDAYACTDQLADLLAPMGKHVPRLLIYDALRACASDGDLKPHELSTIKASARKLDIPEQEVDALRAIVEEEEALKRRKIAAVFPQGAPYKTSAGAI